MNQLEKAENGLEVLAALLKQERYRSNEAFVRVVEEGLRYITDELMQIVKGKQKL